MSKATLLVVDDIELNRAVLKACLADEYRIIEACSGVEALKLLACNKSIDVVITDLQMPEMDGTELIRQIRKNPLYNHIAILANTQYGEPIQEEHLLELGANDFVYKPTTPIIVKSRVRSVLRH